MRFAELAADDKAKSYEVATNAIMPVMQAGDLLLWDARALHCSYPSALGSGQAAEPELLRATVHMCLSERSLATAEVLEQRRWAYVRLFRTQAIDSDLSCKNASAVFPSSLHMHPSHIGPNGRLVPFSP